MVIRITVFIFLIISVIYSTESRGPGQVRRYLYKAKYELLLYELIFARYGVELYAVLYIDSHNTAHKSSNSARRYSVRIAYTCSQTVALQRSRERESCTRKASIDLIYSVMSHLPHN